MQGRVADRLDRPDRTQARVGPLLLWFAVLGGTTAWAVHLLVGWYAVELACSRGREQLLGLPLRGFVGVATALPGLVAVLALVLAWRLWRRDLHDADGGRVVGRARFMAQVGFWTDALAVLMILFGAAALLVFPPCTG